jgi:hypothetical protein
MFKRETIKFLIPTNMSSILTNSVGDRKVVPLYINPSNIQTSYSKNISETQTIGGFIIQYWGDRITTMTIGGTTGSGGIDAINVLYDVYKSEQTSFRNMMIVRSQQLKNSIRDSLGETEDTNALALQALDQVLFDGAFSEISNGVSETMDFFKKSITGEQLSEQNNPLQLMPTLSAFAVSLEMHFQGKISRGYIESMSVTEEGANPGHFNYTIQFKCLKEYGERSNFMPWHTNPRDESGKPIQKPKVGPDALNYNLSFPIVDIRTTSASVVRSSSRVTDDQVGTSEETGDVNNFSRRSKITSK